LTFNAVPKEIKDVPVSRLEEPYRLVHSLTPKAKPTGTLRKKILPYGGAFSGMSSGDHADFLDQAKKTRASLFDRNIGL